MKPNAKRIEEVRPIDFDHSPIWEYDLDEEEIIVFPIEEVPVNSLDNRFVGTRVRLGNGHLVWATLSNIDLHDFLRTRHFLMISLFFDGSWFHLARYFDVDFADAGPAQLAAAMRLPIDQVFPITYDIRYCCTGTSEGLVGEIGKVSEETLSRSELISLAVPDPEN